MKHLFLILLLFIIPQENPLELAQKAYEAGEYEKSAKHFQEAMLQYPALRTEIKYNLGQCYEALGMDEQANRHYHQAALGMNGEIASKAWNHLGILALRAEEYIDALEAFKKALEQNPDNEYARFNYELLMKRLKKEEEKQEQENEEQEEEQEEEEEEDTSDEGSEEKDEETDDPTRDGNSESEAGNSWAGNPPVGTEDAGALKMDTISLQQAQKLLEAMRENEVRFLQQLQKRSAAKKSNSQTPDNQPSW